MASVLIVEDNKEINSLLNEFLTSENYRVLSAFNGFEALNILKERNDNDIDIVLLDLMLPYKSGEMVLEEIRKFSDVPVIIVSAKDNVRTKIDIIRMGADDYITKPFDFDELLARIEAVLRRKNISEEKTTLKKIIKYKSLVMDRTSSTVTVKGKRISLRAKEYAILELLLLNPTKLFSKANLFESVWNAPYYGGDISIKVHISNLRNKLGEASDEEYIETVWGMGYKLK